MPKQKIAFIINPVSGQKNKKTVQKTVEQYLDTEKFEPFFAQTEYAGHGQILAQQFVNQGFDIVVAVGGDGTVNEIARALVHTQTALGIIPAGSGNGLALYLKIPKNVAQAVLFINQANIVDADYGLLNNQAFFCTCGVGFDALVSADFAKGKIRGFIGYLWVIIRAFLRYKPKNYQLIAENYDFEVNAFMINFANISQWGYNACIAPNANIHDGKMEITILKKFPFFAAPRLAAQLFLKRIAKNRYVNTLTASKITVLSNNEDKFHFDGEPCQMSKEINIKIIKDGIKLLTK
jgi:YegS/Rv2252/BmrU family lipid kinase